MYHFFGITLNKAQLDFFPINYGKIIFGTTHCLARIFHRLNYQKKKKGLKVDDNLSLGACQAAHNDTPEN
jgi:hypothetical protein